MVNENYCKCGMPWVEQDGSCSKCNLEINPSRLEILSVQAESDLGSTKQPSGRNATTKKGSNLDNSQKEKLITLGWGAADRTEKYATIFQNLGQILQLLNSIGFGILFIIVWTLDVNGNIKLVYSFALLLLAGFTYLQIALIRGIASYFQMRAIQFKISMGGK